MYQECPQGQVLHLGKNDHMWVQNSSRGKKEMTKLTNAIGKK